MDSIVITIIYDPKTQKLRVNVGTTSDDPQINIRDVLLAVTATLQLYIGQLGSATPEQPGEGAEG